jgi:hypothetical protein
LGRGIDGNVGAFVQNAQRQIAAKVALAPGNHFNLAAQPQLRPNRAETF